MERVKRLANFTYQDIFTIKIKQPNLLTAKCNVEIMSEIRTEEQNHSSLT